MTLLSELTAILSQVLHLDSGHGLSKPESKLLGAIPEFDSMAVVSIITELENRYGIVVEDDEIDADVFETVGSLLQFLERKRADAA
jgi:acyl carrier protein